uniref:Uncharacterized protein n=1 Tax=Timema monikensis TaxID=170555 RepID=A0A7R9E9T7_9NEOP|nr:unnamed protein product [Timema monikensis]
MFISRIRFESLWGAVGIDLDIEIFGPVFSLACRAARLCYPHPDNLLVKTLGELVSQFKDLNKQVENQDSGRVRGGWRRCERGMILETVGSGDGLYDWFRGSLPSPLSCAGDSRTWVLSLWQLGEKYHDEGDGLQPCSRTTNFFCSSPPPPRPCRELRCLICLKVRIPVG